TVFFYIHLCLEFPTCLFIFFSYYFIFPRSVIEKNSTKNVFLYLPFNRHPCHALHYVNSSEVQHNFFFLHPYFPIYSILLISSYLSIFLSALCSC
ncbi:hypothetical protein BX070DRAFT_242582, partial [Coemansia spiralis]